jgi:hypothetical protein
MLQPKSQFQIIVLVEKNDVSLNHKRGLDESKFQGKNSGRGEKTERERRRRMREQDVHYFGHFV